MKTAVVTGASAGIGKAIAGYAVSITARSTDALTQTKDECVKAGLQPDQVLITSGDLTQKQVAEDVIRNTITKFGEINVLWPGCSFYCMSKAALDMYTKSLALELASDGVRVNSVNPGVIATDFQLRCGLCNEDNKQEVLTEMGLQHPIGRRGTPEEIAKTVYFLASEDSSFTTGSILMVDGGRTLAA